MKANKEFILEHIGNKRIPLLFIYVNIAQKYYTEESEVSRK